MSMIAAFLNSPCDCRSLLDIFTIIFIIAALVATPIVWYKLR